MSLQQYFGRWEEQARTVDASGAWRAWATAQPVLEDVGSALALGEAVMDRGQQGRANELLFALVLIAAAEGGADPNAATFVASLLVPGGNRIIRSLTSLGPEVDAMVAGQLWIQVREYPCASRPRAVAKNILMDTRRAVLRDYGASTHRRAARRAGRGGSFARKPRSIPGPVRSEMICLPGPRSDCCAVRVERQPTTAASRSASGATGPLMRVN